MKRQPLDSRNELLQALKVHLDFCQCAYSDTALLLRDFLRLVVKRSAATTDKKVFRKSSKDIVKFLEDNASTGMRSLFVYSMEKADLITHGFNLYDVWSTSTGEWLLAGLEKFADDEKLLDVCANEEECHGKNA